MSSDIAIFLKATDGSKMENKPFVGFASIDMSDGISWKFRIAKI
jgi:hypothetical protein